MMTLSRYFSEGKLLLLSFLFWNIPGSTGFVHNNLRIATSEEASGIIRNIPRNQYINKQSIRPFAAANDDADIDTGSDGESNDDEEVVSTVRYKDDGMTDRFKYKVHALMGDYDPTEGMVDNEDQDGNIMKALITFPTQHVFDVVGKIQGDNNSDSYADQVRSIVFETTGDENIQCEIIPRGKKFVKVRCEATVESTTMINTIYEELGAMESTVMKF